MSDGFGAHDPKHGPRLQRQLALGPGGVMRQVRGPVVGPPPVAPGPAPAGGVAERRERAGVSAGVKKAMGVFEAGLRARREAEKAAAPSLLRKPGPPPGERPWEGLGISRRTYFRRKAEGAL